VTDFESLVGGADLTEGERSQLLSAHEALLLAGPPAELSPALAGAPRVDAEVVALPRGRRRAAWLLAAAIALVAFALGTTTNRYGGEAFAAAWTHQLQPTKAAPAGAWASIAGSKRDSAGNWKMLLKTGGLPQLHGKDYYVLWLTKNGKPVAECGTFLVKDGTTVATFAEPYEVKEFDGWVVTHWRGPKAPVGPALLKVSL
jgi:hypothetical protein